MKQTRYFCTGGADTKRNHLGQFARIRKHWSLDNFNDGYIDGGGRFRVYFPEHPRAFKEGYVLRSIVAYEAYHKDIVTPDFAIHHKNKNRLDDSEENLEKKLFGQHTRDHFILPKVELICCKCRNIFYRYQWRINQYKRSGHVNNYCSQDCYNNRRKTVYA